MEQTNYDEDDEKKKTTKRCAVLTRMPDDDYDTGGCVIRTQDTDIL